MTSLNDEKRKSATSKSKPAKSQKGQRTLYDMLGMKKPDKADSQQTTTTSSPTQSADGEEPPTEATVIPDSTDTTHSIDTLVTTPKQKASEIPTIQSRFGPTLEDTAFIKFGGSDVELDEPSGLSNEDALPGSLHMPIIIPDSSPMRPTSKSIEDPETPQVSEPEMKKPIHPFFVPRLKLKNSTVPTSPRRRRTNDVEAAFPDRGNQHVKGIQTLYSSPSCPFARRRHGVVSPAGNTRAAREKDTPILDFLLPCKVGKDEDPCDDGVISRISEPQSHLGSIDQGLIRGHPAIERAVEAAKLSAARSTNGQLWTDAWRPRCAKEVLGNERSAIYLRNWLHTLALELNPSGSEDANKKRKKKAKKRERVVREVPRKKQRRDGLDGFLAEDDEVDDVDPKGLTEDEEELINASRQLGLAEMSSFASDAPEAINGRLHNTILLTGPPGTGKTAAVFACAEELGWEVFEVYPGIGRRNGANVDNLVGEVGKSHLVRTKGGAGRLVSTGATESGTEEGTSEAGIKQSLILLEEVDILFKEDVNFWAGVTNLISECRRPVICTCNDASLVPMDELPLQKVLYFEAVAPEVGTAYLQSVACAEGYAVLPERVMEVYCDTYELAGADVPGETSWPTAHKELPEHDLRRAIHGVQIGCSTGGRWKSQGTEDEEEEWYMKDEALRCDDDENGHTVLYSEIGDRDVEAIRLARGQVAPELARGDLRWDVFRARLAYQALVGRTGWLAGPGQESDWTEKIPVLREMGRVVLGGKEEWEEGRRTRNSTRGRRAGEAVRSVGIPVLAAACSGMEWATWGGRAVD